MTPASEPGSSAGSEQDAATGATGLRHWAGFLFSGGLAFAVDWGVLELCVRVFGWPPLLARLVSIFSAMLVAWVSHRTLTFAVRAPPTWAEFAKYVAAASTTAALNYSVFAGLMFALPAVGRFWALFVSSILATIFSYLSMRYGVFRRA